MRRKAQFSMEYLSTYVYMAMGLAVVLGALTYFGAFDIKTFAKEDCESGQQIVCVDE